MIYISPSADQGYNANNAQPMVGFDNLLTRGTRQNPDLPVIGPRRHAADENTTKFWRPTGADVFRTTFFTLAPVDFAFFAAHTLAGLTVSVQKFDGTTWTDIQSVVPADNRPFMMLFPFLGTFGVGVSVSGACQIGVAWIGPRVVIPGGVVPGYAEVWAARNYRKLGGGTRRGHWTGQRIDAVTASLAPQLMPVTKEFARTTLRPFGDRYNEGRAFVWASAPSVFPEDAAYCWAEDGAIYNPRPQAGGELYDLSLQMSAYCEP